MKIFGIQSPAKWSKAKDVVLTKGNNDGASDTVGHNHSEDAHHPSISSSKLEFIGLMLKDKKEDTDSISKAHRNKQAWGSNPSKHLLKVYQN